MDFNFCRNLITSDMAPGITKSYAENKVVKKFEGKNENISDSCGFNCDGCGVEESDKTLFGHSIKIEYACGLLPTDSPEYHRTATKFVSFLGTIH